MREKHSTIDREHVDELLLVRWHYKQRHNHAAEKDSHTNKDDED